ncbi:hypothetical protein OAQ99_07655, partial [Candidatus Kapabacteria bacterium]|nr:hypothetical protein [Candidatus Kapabacteria bacterium]
LNELIELNQIEVSYSPYNHPILPLLVDSNSANDSLNNLDIEGLEFKWAQDSFNQIKKSIEKYKNDFRKKQVGMWPSEGSLSNDVLNQLIENEIDWTATDEIILKNSDPNYKSLEKYFPRKYQSDKGNITIFFRDNTISDKIGFAYPNWEPQKAVDDFFLLLHNIRNGLIEEYGEFALDYACVNIILDGENCWEYYPNLGVEFRNKLMQRLNDDSYFESVLFKDVCKNNETLLTLNNIKAGSWINGNFKIWIGEKIHKKSWEILSDVRLMIEGKKDHKKYSIAMEYIYRAESSDWFWWYFSEHWAPNKADFDVLFRYNLEKALNILGLPIPSYLIKPIWSKEELEKMKQHLSQSSNTMHQVSF